MKFKINTRTIWEVGQRTDKSGMPHQEDSLYPSVGKDDAPERLFLICDGMGGHAAGEVASATVCDAIAQSIASADPEAQFSVSALNKALDSAFESLDLLECDDLRKPGTTLALLKLHPDGAMIAHIGDSRVMHLRPGIDASDTRILHVTSDHSLVNDLVKAGELTPEEARRSSQRNIITRAMQPRLTPRPEADLYTTSDIRPGDYFYLCSDGMLEEMDEDSLRAVFSREGGDIEKKREILTRATERNMDNHTAILVEITDVEQGRVLTRSVTGLVTPEVERQALEAAGCGASVASAPEELVAEPVHEANAGNRAVRNGGNIWAWVIIVAIVAAAAVYIFTMMSGKKEAAPATAADTVATVSPAHVSDMPGSREESSGHSDGRPASATRHDDEAGAPASGRRATKAAPDAAPEAATDNALPGAAEPGLREPDPDKINNNPGDKSRKSQKGASPRFI